ncbi:hypothetical protein BDZ89DRAFT_610426 [Hymenopellis radicata]|nr:hypothetical protein BDZ89DRAFT_610426 [Hymenopellis radicata]
MGPNWTGGLGLDDYHSAPQVIAPSDASTAVNRALFPGLFASRSVTLILMIDWQTIVFVFLVALTFSLTLGSNDTCLRVRFLWRDLSCLVAIVSAEYVYNLRRDLRVLQRRRCQI